MTLLRYRVRGHLQRHRRGYSVVLAFGFTVAVSPEAAAIVVELLRLAAAWLSFGN